MSHFSIPVSVKLTSEHNWYSLDEQSSAFGIVRFHFFIEDVASNGDIVFGEPFGVYKKPKGVKVKRTESETTTVERLVSRKSIENYLLQREELEELAAEVLAKSTVLEVFKFGSSIKERVSSKLTASLSIGEEISASLKVTTTETVTIENELPEDFDETILSVPAYTRREAHIHLTHIDFLRVHYRRSPFGLRKKAKNEPAVVDFERHPNRVEIRKHFATAIYWQLMPKSSCFVLSKDYKTSVANATEILVCPPQVERRKKVEFPHVPTLYQIAKAAFPKKWVWRKSLQKAWTEEELMAIELDEVRGRPGWWFRHGPAG